MAAEGVWMRGKWRYLYVQLDGAHITPQSCNCVFARGGRMVFDPLECPIDCHRVEFMQVKDRRRLRAERFPWIGWDKTADWTNRVQVVGGTTEQVAEPQAEMAQESAVAVAVA